MSGVRAEGEGHPCRQQIRGGKSKTMRGKEGIYVVEIRHDYGNLSRLRVPIHAPCGVSEPEYYGEWHPCSGVP